MHKADPGSIPSNPCGLLSTTRNDSWAEPGVNPEESWLWSKNYAKKAKPKTNKDFRYPGNENSNQTKFPVLIGIYSSTVTVTEFSKHNAREITLKDWENSYEYSYSYALYSALGSIPGTKKGIAPELHYEWHKNKRIPRFNGRFWLRTRILHILLYSSSFLSPVSKPSYYYEQSFNALVSQICLLPATKNSITQKYLNLYDCFKKQLELRGADLWQCFSYCTFYQNQVI